MTAGATTLAAGGERHVPVPDEVARDYLLLGLRLDQHVPGLVDGYFGPADLKAQVDIESVRSPAALAADAEALLARIGDEVEPPDRRDWLSAQAVALRTQARALAGDELSYVEHVTRCFAWSPVRRDNSVFEAAAAELDALLPGSAPIAERLAAWDARFAIPVDRLPAIVDWLVARFRARAASTVRDPGRRGPPRHARSRPAVDRLQLVRRRPPLARRHQHRPADPRGGPHPHRRARDVPGPPP